MSGKATKRVESKAMVFAIMFTALTGACENSLPSPTDGGPNDSGRPVDSGATPSVETACLRVVLRRNELSCDGGNVATATAVCREFNAYAAATGCNEQAIDFYECSGRFTAAECNDSPFARCSTEVAAWETCVDQSNADQCYETCRQAVSAGCSLASEQCFGECLSARGTTAAAGCEDPYNAYLQCLAGLPNICDRASCDDERSALTSCGS